MSKDKKHTTTSFDEFKAYLDNKISLKSKHTFEKKVLDDDFESEALDGFEKFNTDEADEDLRGLSGKISSKLSRTSIKSWQLAAIIVLFISATISIFYIVSPDKNPDVAQKKEANEVSENKTDTIKSETNQPTTIQESDETIAENTTQTKQEIIHRETNSKDEPLSALAQSRAPEHNNEMVEPPLDEEVPSKHIQETFLEKKKIDIPDASGIKETQLEPLPETGDLNRVASAEVLSTDDKNLKHEDVEIPSSIVYDEGIKDKPESGKSKSFAYTLSRKKEIAKQDRNLIPSSQAAEETEVKSSESHSDAHPTIGMDAYKKYIKDNLSFQISPDSLTIHLLINVKGEIDEIKFEDVLTEQEKSEIEKMIKEGPKWESAMNNGTSYPQEIQIIIK